VQLTTLTFSRNYVIINIENEKRRETKMLHLLLLLLAIGILAYSFIFAIVIPYLISIESRYYDEDEDEFIL
jgi:hypothetical protein